MPLELEEVIEDPLFRRSGYLFIIRPYKIVDGKVVFLAKFKVKTSSRYRAIELVLQKLTERGLEFDGMRIKQLTGWGVKSDEV